MFLPGYSWLSLGLIMIAIYAVRRPVPAGLRVTISVVFIYYLPLLLLPFLASLVEFSGLPQAASAVLSAAGALPVIYLLDNELRQPAGTAVRFHRNKAGKWHITPASGTFLITAAVLTVTGAVLNSLTLLFTSTIFFIYLLAALVKAFSTLAKLPAGFPVQQRRVIAGTEIHVPFHIRGETFHHLRGALVPLEPWVEVTPQSFSASREDRELDISLIPSMAGIRRPEFWLKATDERGLLRVVKRLYPVELQVIPRAKYAEWLANRYLETAGTSVTAGSPQLSQAIPLRKRGVDYHDSRAYQPGDQYKDIDWKHTAKLNQLISKEYIGSGEQSAVVAVNLSATDVEEADRLAFDLITTLLTLAREAIPTALAAYDREEVVRYTGMGEPGEALKQALSLVKHIHIIEATPRWLHLPDISKLKQHIYQIKEADSEPVRRLREILDFEHRALEKAARDHPASRALALTTRQAPAAATVILISRRNHDDEALLIAAEKLARQEFSILKMTSTT